MIFIFLIFISYCIFILLLLAGWKKALGKKLPLSAADELSISVIIPVRNENPANLRALLNSLMRQDYEPHEIIFIDDHSVEEADTGSGKLFFNNLKTVKNFRVIQNEGQGKKHALTTGVKNAKGVLIVTTDSDCVVPDAWLQTISKVFYDRKVSFAFGPVRIRQRSFFSILQSIEFASLIGTGAATSALGAPTMCNGANLAYRKKDFERVSGYEGNFEIASGDDEFLMRKILAVNPGGIRFIGDPSAIVETHPQENIQSFFMQRLRWASKWKNNSSFFAKFLAMYVVFCQLGFLSAVFLLVSSFSWQMLFLVLAKVFLDMLFLLAVCRLLYMRLHLSAFLLLQVLYPFYVITVGACSFFLRYTWRGRKS